MPEVKRTIVLSDNSKASGSDEVAIRRLLLLAANLIFLATASAQVSRAPLPARGPRLLSPSDSHTAAEDDTKRAASESSGADACARIQAAHDALPSTGGSIVADFAGLQPGTTAITITKNNVTFEFFTGATYNFTANGRYAIGTTADNTRISGNGALFQATVAWSHGHYNIFESTANDGFTIEGAQVQLTMTGSMPKVQALAHGISVQTTIGAPGKAPTNFTVRNNRVQARGNVTDSTVFTKPTGIFVGSYHATNIARGGLVEGNVFDDSYGRNVMVYHCENVKVEGNISTNHGLTLAHGKDAGAKHIRIIGSRHISVMGNTASSAGSKGYIRVFTVEGDSESADVTFAGNTAHLSGTFTETGGVGMYVSHAKGVTFSGNVVEYAGNDVAGFDGLLIFSFDGPVSDVNTYGNIIKGWTQAQFRVGDNTPTDIIFRNNVLGRSGGGAENYVALVADPTANRICGYDNIHSDGIAASEARETIP